MEVTVAGEVLPDDGRADDYAILRDELAVGLIAHGELCDSRNHQGIDDAEKNGGDQCVTNCDDERAAHESFSSDQVKPLEGQVDQLDSDEGGDDSADSVDDEVEIG